MSRKDAEMSKIPVEPNILLYYFVDLQTKLPDTITVLLAGQEALLIDTAFPEYAARVKEDLAGQGMAVKKIVLSHYHADHVSGCPVFAPCDIYAGEFYEYNFNNCQIWEPYFTYLRPTHLLRHQDTLAFGAFSLRFLYAPGHSKCSMITRVTDDIVHVGDLLMQTKDGKAALPFIADGGSFSEHIDSLAGIKKLAPEAIIVPHGGLFRGRQEIAQMVDDRVCYLEKTSSTMGTLPLPACLLHDISAYDHLEFHDTNILRLMV